MGCGEGMAICMAKVLQSEPLVHVRPPYALYCLFMLVLISILDQADRWALPTLQASGLQCSSCGEPSESFYAQCVRHCLDFSDLQMGLLTGPAFSVSAVLMAAPLGWLADRYARVRILLCGLVVWSLATLASAFIQHYWQLLLCRVLLGVGQATVSPTAYSLLAEYFSPHRRALVMAAFSSMVFVGQVLGLLTGILTQYSSWRVAFFVLGAPGLALALPFALTVLEPKRGGKDVAVIALDRAAGATDEGGRYREREREREQDGDTERERPRERGGGAEKEKEDQEDREGEVRKEEAPRDSSPDDCITMHEERAEESATDAEEESAEVAGTIVQNLTLLLSTPWFVALFLSGSCRFLAGYALGSWVQVFYRRVYGLSPTEVSLWMSFVVPVGGLGGAYVGGMLADAWSARSIAGKAYTCAFSSFLAVPPQAASLLAYDSTPSFLLLLLAYFTAEMWYGPAVAIVQDNTRPTLRSFATTLYLISGAVGAISPMVIGYLNDVLAREIVYSTPTVSGASAEDAYDPTIPLLIMVPGMYLLAGFLFLATGFLLQYRGGAWKLRTQHGAPMGEEEEETIPVSAGGV